MKSKYGMLAVLIVSLSVLSLLFIVFSFKNKSFGRTGQQELSQTNQKKINRMQIPDEPFDVMEYKVKAKEVKLGKNFFTEGDWLRGFEFKFKNKAEKPMTCILFDLDFPETKSDRPMMAYQFTLGQRTGPNGNFLGNPSTPLFLIKNEEMNFRLPDDDYQRIDKFLATRGYSVASITTVRLRIYQIYFSDGSMWVTGATFLPDPTSPKGYRKIE